MFWLTHLNYITLWKSSLSKRVVNERMFEGFYNRFIKDIIYFLISFLYVLISGRAEEYNFFRDIWFVGDYIFNKFVDTFLKTMIELIIT